MNQSIASLLVLRTGSWGLRDYGIEGQIGLEETPDLFVANMVAVFREVRRVLTPHGTCWVNLGDSYATTPTGNRGTKSGLAGAGSAAYGATLDRYVEATLARPPIPEGLKPKDLVGIPWRVAFALQADGWYLRSDIVWAKPNPMPESVTDRPTKSHEYVFLLTKAPRYWFDAEAVRERYTGTGGDSYGVGRKDGPTFSNAPRSHARGPDGRKITHVEGRDGSEQHRNGERWPNPSGRNVRSVWQIATRPYPEAHFATFPEELARRCILAGCPVLVCRVCGKPSKRIVERGESDYARLKREQGHEWTDMDAAGLERGVIVRPGEGGQTRKANGTVPSLRAAENETLGWSDCGHNNWRPGTVLDPFIGSGTTAKVARDHGRHAIGIDLNETYLELAARRSQQLSLLNEGTA